MRGQAHLLSSWYTREGYLHFWGWGVSQGADIHTDLMRLGIWKNPGQVLGLGFAGWGMGDAAWYKSTVVK